MKIYRNFLIIGVAIVILVVSLVLVHKLPSDSKDNEVLITENNEGKKEYIDIFKLDSGSISKIDVRTEKESYSVTQVGDELYLSDSQNLLISHDRLNMFLNSCAYVYAERIISSKHEDAITYGFDDPSAEISVVLNDGSFKKILVGRESVDKQSRYFMVEGDKNIYLRGAYGVGNLMPEYNSFVETAIFSVDPSDYSTLTSFSMNKSGNTAIEISSFGTDETKTWKIIKPTYADANTITLSEKVLIPLSSLTVSAVVEARATDLSKYGLDSPYAEVRISSDTNSQKLFFGDEVEGYRFLQLDNYDTVYAVSSANTSFLDVSYIDLMSRLVHLENIKNVDRVEIAYVGGSFSMLIDGDSRSINNIQISKDDFADVYQRVIGISFDSVDLNESTNSVADVEIKYYINDGSTCVVSFVSVDDRNYLALVDGKGNSIVKKSNVTDVIEYTKEMIEGEK